MPVTVTGLDEGVPAVWALVGLFLAMRLLVVNHVTELGRLDVTFQAPKELISPACALVDHIVLLETHVAGIWPVSVAYSLLDDLLEGWHSSYTAAAHRLSNRRTYLTNKLLVLLH